jgi:lysophospholipase III
VESLKLWQMETSLFVDEQGEYFADLKKLVEDTYELNHQSKISFLAHSLGNMYLLYFLNRQSQDWKDKYVSSFIGMGGPWGGAVKPLKVIATGDDLDIAIVSRSKMRDVLRTNPSVSSKPFVYQPNDLHIFSAGCRPFTD